MRGGYDLNVAAGQMQMVIGPSGGTIVQEFGGYYNDSNGGFWMNDLGQLSGSGAVHNKWRKPEHEAAIPRPEVKEHPHA